ncbi:phospholipid carrier-dependent glycosyltransferase [Nocardioides panacihumi]|uniref:Polyprenol-phosphate-mannose--protein mannosyltransferase n=1 Tax=Nocardioides panacihumi TaxID=400774 RepID=A0ABN2QU38_9ACTN
MTVIDDPAEREGQTVSLSRTASGAPVPTARERARSLLHGRDPVVGWCATVIVTVFALVMRLWHLGTPREFQFDETYYAKDAWSLLHFGYARNYAEGANDKILAGHTMGSFQNSPEMVVHPEVGKWLIALGEKAFGMDPFGWRVSSAVAGALMILVMIRLVRRMTGSTLIGVVAGLLLSFDGLQFVLSRLALLDIFLALFTLCAVSCAVADRDWFRERVARTIGSPATGWGPRVLWRPWLLASGLFWGLAIGTKWTALYPLAAFGVLVFVWSAGARRSFGVRTPLLRSAVMDGVPAFVHLVVVAALVYTVSWTGWLMHAHTYEQSLSSTQYTQYSGQGHCEKQTYVSDNPDSGKHWPTAKEPDARGLGEVTQSLRSLWYYHEDVWTFHTHFLNCATHPYASSPAGWLLLNRPVGVAATNDIKPGDQGCTAPQGSTCIRQVLLLGTPLLWWGGLVALLYAVAMWLGARDWRFGVAVVGVASTWLPWFSYADRPIFSYYAIVSLPFLVLALALAIGKLIGQPDSRRRTAGVVISGAYLVLVILNFAWFWPIYTDALLTHAQWLDRIWFQRWI